jgi:hypothetical protein
MAARARARAEDCRETSARARAGKEERARSCVLNSAALAALSSMVVRNGGLAGGSSALVQFRYLHELGRISVY